MSKLLPLCALYVFFVVLFLFQDILKTVWNQFKGIPYEWYTIKVLKEKHDWWKWLLSILAFCAGVYYLLPNSVIGKADFRANRELPEYTAYYECEYSIENYGSGSGYVSVRREDGSLCATWLFTDNGKIALDLYMEGDKEDRSSVRGSIANDYYADVDIGSGPLKRDSIPLNYNDVYLAPNPLECDSCWEFFCGDYAFETTNGYNICPLCAEEELNALLNGEVLRCYYCEGYYYPSDSDGFGLCYNCCQEYISSCHNCGDHTYRWHADDFTLCPKCAGEIFSDERVSGAVKAWFED